MWWKTGKSLLLPGSSEGDIGVGLSRRSEAERKLLESILDAGAEYVGDTRNGDGQIYHMSTPNGPIEIRIMQQKPDQTNPFLDNRTIIVRQGSVGQGTGEYTYGNGTRILGSVSKSERKAIGHTHGKTP